MKIIAHRGASWAAPENTLAAFRMAWREEADGIELDVRMTRDEEIVVIHDDNTFRTTGVDAPVVGRSIEQLKRLDAGSWKDPGWRSEPIPLLDEVLEIVPPGKMIFIEIKCGPEILSELRGAVQASRLPPQQIVFVGFSLETMRLAKLRFPDSEVLWNVESSRLEGASGPDQAISQILHAHLDGLGPGIGGSVNADLAARFKERGLKLFVWTIDDPAVGRQMKDLGIDYLATNRPGHLRNAL